MTYSETIVWLFQQFPAYHLQGVSAYKPSLDNIEALSAAFGHPERSLRFVHIAGTNGKGSTSNMLASILQESGEKTGLFTSPHLYDFTERIRINGIPVEEQFVIRFCEDVRRLELAIDPSFFEITWLMALCWFRDQHCTIVVAETGLGGRLDATNIVFPLVSVITNISLDHTAILGNTRALIAAEKAGIIKQAVPVVLGEYDEEILPVIERIASEKKAPIHKATEPAFFPEGIIGYQKENFTTVYAALTVLNGYPEFQLSEEHIRNGIQHLRKNTGFTGRLEILGTDPLIMLDCAHNVAGIKKTLESISDTIKGELHIVYGTSSDKELGEIANALPKNARYYFTQFSNPRSATTVQLQEAFSDISSEARFFEEALTALTAAKTAARTSDTILIFGSFFLVSDVIVP